MYGPLQLLSELSELGLKAELLQASDGNSYAVISAFEIQLGRFANRIIGLGILATPDFPCTVASAIHVKAEPQLFDYQDTVANIRNIIQSPLGGEWRYWSKGFDLQGERSVRRLISKINEVFLNA
jgi:hypothetical protein